MRFIFLFVLFILQLKAIPFCQSYSEDLKTKSYVLSILSLQTAFEYSQNLSLGVGANIGVSYVWINDDRLFDIGWRIKYLYLDSSVFEKNNNLAKKTHLAGALLYIHPFPNAYYRATGAIITHKDCEGQNDGYPTPFSFLIGAGANFSSNNLGNANGGYIEAGIAFFKWFPLNAEISYRVNFLEKNNFGLDKISHSIVFALNIL